MPYSTGGDVGGHGVAHPAQPVEVVGGDRLLEPAHVAVGGGCHEPHRLLGGVAAVGVDEQLGVGADDGAGLGDAGQVALGPVPHDSPILILTRGMPLATAHPVSCSRSRPSS